MNVITLSELLNRPVVATDDATEVGEVKNISLDRGATRVERVQVGGRKRSPELVDWRAITGVGGDAVMIDSSSSVHASREDEDDASYVRGDIEVIGAAVTTTAGFEAGTVNDLHIAEESGEIVAAITSEGRIEAARIRSLGTFGMVVA